MSYKIRKSDGTLLLELGDGFTDNTVSSLTFIGKNVSKFGEIQNNDFLHLLENFSALTEPANKITGQLWFDKTHNVIKVFNEDKWQSLSVMTYSTSSSFSSSTGNLWFNPDTAQLFINNGSASDAWYSSDAGGVSIPANSIVATTYGGGGNNSTSTGKLLYVNNINKPLTYVRINH